MSPSSTCPFFFTTGSGIGTADSSAWVYDDGRVVDVVAVADLDHVAEVPDGDASEMCRTTARLWEMKR